MDARKTLCVGMQVLYASPAITRADGGNKQQNTIGSVRYFAGQLITNMLHTPLVLGYACCSFQWIYNPVKSDEPIAPGARILSRSPESPQL